MGDHGQGRTNTMKFITQLLHPKVKVKIIERDPLRITLAEWQASPDMTQLAKLALNNKTVRQMLDVLWANQMGKWAMSMNVSLEQRAVHSALCEGYAMALNDFEALGMYRKPDQPLEATFEPPVEEYEQSQ